MSRLLVCVVLCAASASFAQAETDIAEGPAVREPPEANASENVGFGGSGAEVDPAQVEQLEGRIRQLEASLQEQSAELAEARDALSELGERVGQEEGLSQTEAERTVETQHAARAESRAARADAIQRALADIEVARELVEAGSDEVGPRVSAALQQLDAALVDAARWGSAAEAERLTRAATLVQQVPSMLDTENFQNAMVALVAARELTAAALTLAE